VTPTQPGTDLPAPDLPGVEVIAALIDPLLDARTQPAADEFDRLILGAVTAGSLDQELARQLRFWQRASVHELADHIRTVLPAVLPVAVAAVTTSVAEAEGAAVAAAATWEATSTPVQVEVDRPDAEPLPEVVVSAPDENALNTEPPGDDTESDPAASTTHLRRRMFVAGLTSTA
jgi:hypothetical protein